MDKINKVIKEVFDAKDAKLEEAKELCVKLDKILKEKKIEINAMKQKLSQKEKENLSLKLKIQRLTRVLLDNTASQVDQEMVDTLSDGEQEEESRGSGSGSGAVEVSEIFGA